MKFIGLIFLSVFLIICSLNSAMAENNFRFQSELEFKHDSSILPGELENYSLYNNEDVKLLIGFFEQKSFLSEVKKYSSESLKGQLLEKSSQLDVINDQAERAVTNFKVTHGDNLSRIEVEYSLLKKNQKWREINVYVLSSKASSFAALQYPEGIDEAEQKELKKGMQNFTLQDEKVVSGKSFFNGTTFSALAAMTAHKFTNVVGNLLISETFAAAAETENNSCDTKKYIIRGEFSSKKGSALFNFQKIVNDLEDEASKSQPSEKQLSCLSNFYKKAKDNAATYWSERGMKEGCIGSDGAILSKKEKTCSDSTFKEMNNSLKYLDNIDAGLKSFLGGGEVVRSTCQGAPAEVSAEMQAFSKLNASVQQTFCCSSGNSDLDKGPLFSVLESENDNFKKLTPAAQAEMCLLKTKDENKKFVSADGLGDCLQSMLEGVGKIIKDLIKTAASLFDLETIKALGQFVANLPSSAGNLLTTIGEHIGAQLYSVTNCMSPYESKQYMCKMVPGVAATLLGPGMIKTFAKALVEKAGKTAIAELVLKAAQENKQFTKLKEIAGNAGRSTKKIVKPIMNSKILKPALSTLAKITAMLGKDVSTPIKELIQRKAKAAGAAAALKAESLAKKVLRREVVAEEVAAVKVPLKDLPRTDVSTMVQGADGVFREERKALSLEARQEKMQAYKDAQASGNQVAAAQLKEDLLHGAGELTDQERIVLVNSFKSGKALTSEEERLILNAHVVGQSAGRGFGSYSRADIGAKADLMKQAGIRAAEERRFFMETGVTGTNGIKLKYGEAERLAGERVISDAFATKGKTEIEAGMVRTRNYYNELFNLDDKNFAKAFDIEKSGLVGIKLANETGMTVKESADALKRMIKVHNYDEVQSMNSVIHHLTEDISEYEAMMKKGYNPGIDYKIYRSKELKAELIERDLTAKYKDKYNELDFDKVPQNEMKELQDIREELAKIRKAKAKLWPVEASTSY